MPDVNLPKCKKKWRIVLRLNGQMIPESVYIVQLFTNQPITSSLILPLHLLWPVRFGIPPQLA